MLSDDSIGVLYNDSTRMILHQNGEQLTYMDKDFHETVFPKSNYPAELKKKVSLIDYFRKYMNEHLLKVKLFYYSFHYTIVYISIFNLLDYIFDWIEIEFEAEMVKS